MVSFLFLPKIPQYKTGISIHKTGKRLEWIFLSNNFNVKSLKENKLKMTVSSVGIQPKIVYGLRSDIKGNIHFLENQEVVYPVAGVIAIHDYKIQKQTFLRLAANNVPTVIAISPNRKLLAISEWNQLKKM